MHLVRHSTARGVVLRQHACSPPCLQQQLGLLEGNYNGSGCRGRRMPPHAAAASPDIVQQLGSTTTATASPAQQQPVQEQKHQQQQQRQESGSFNWHRAWYPVAIVSQLHEARPTATQLLGMDMVIWRDGNGSWVVFEDRCPHRLAPLSEGRLEPATGHLMCSYHGAPPLQPVCCSCAQTAWVLEHHNEAILRHKLHSPHKHGKVPAEHTKMWMRQADMCSLQLHAAQPTINAVVLLPAAFASKLLHMFMTLQAGSLTPRASARPFPRLGSQQRTQRRAAASAPARLHTPARLRRACCGCGLMRARLSWQLPARQR
eukprot:GHRQ01015081.1.p1 GENE.GHRQ01015081.1~~GHRQ01015081.1.p1  ORF type:complete len:316 (+),score=77.33 GHRQ01015081.1:348-1295(+)